MTPLDDELRQTLAARAASLAPAADPLAGVEAKAARIRRTRVALAAGGAALAVAAVAVAVQALTPASHPTKAQVAVTTAPTPSPTPTVVAAVPANLLRWGVRGHDPFSPDTLDMRHRFAQALGRPDDPTSYSPLYVDQVDGVSFTFGQAWFDGADQAYTVGYAVGPDNVPQFFLGPVTPTNPWGLAFVAEGMQTYQLLAVVPRPGIGQVSYAAHATGAFEPAQSRSDLNGVVLIQRDLQASDDRLQVLDGDGNIDHPLYEGSVTALLCGLKECG